ncbi:MAG TPA: tripartite tricarboxylate transporter permease [Eubacteriaceae bacterium]|nr:tripartite tricarboxylate transporter permease [Eubacteriaceae bacterium]
MTSIATQMGLLLSALNGILTPDKILLIFAATTMGIIVGAIPGLTGTMALALLINVTYTMQLEYAVAFLLSVYVGAIMGGCYSAIMINIPGTPAAAATALDGFPLARQGKGGKAITAGIIASFLGSIISCLILIFATPYIYTIALKFSQWEYFLLAFFGITICGSLAGGSSPVKGWIVGFLGFLAAMIGLDTIYSYARFTFGSRNLIAGIQLIPALIGVFGISEVLIVLSERVPYMLEQKIGSVLPNKEELKQITKPVARSAIIGAGIGAVPGAGEDIAAWVSYDAGRRRSKEGKKFGTGSFEGLSCAETANNACIPGAMIPLLTLSVPGSPQAAMFMAAIILHGVRPGPMLALEDPQFLYTTAITLFLASFAMLIMGIILTRPMVHVLKLNRKILMPIVVPMTVIGAYATNVNIFDIKVMFIFGFLGFILRKLDFPMAPLVLGLILGEMADKGFRQALMQGQGSIMPLLGRPIGLILIGVIILSIISGMRKYAKDKAVHQETSTVSEGPAHD